MLDDTTGSYAEGFDAGERQSFADRTNGRPGLTLRDAATEWQQGFRDGYCPRTRRWGQGWRNTAREFVSARQRAVDVPELTGEQP